VPDTSRGRNSLVRPAHAADVAQAQLFAEFLRNEVAELEELVNVAETRWSERRDRSGPDSYRPSETLLRLRGRLAEAQKLLENVRTRFLLD
jgi:ATP phosphoribosyltransferase regulatory subunit HisZ